MGNIVVKAPAKAILLGEHAVVYDKLGISAAIDNSTIVSMGKNEHELSYVWNCSGLHHYSFERTEEDINKIYDSFMRSYSAEDFGKIKKMNFPDAVSIVIKKCSDEIGYNNVSIKVDQKRSLKGLGGSAATFVAITKAYANLFGKRITGRKVAEIANWGDRVMHLTPSGIDAATVANGGYLSYRKSEGLAKLDINYRIPILIVNSGETAETSVMVDRVKEARKADEKFVDGIMSELDVIARAGLCDLKDSDVFSFGQKMYEYYDVLRGLDISTPKLDRIVDIARENGALGAKPTGAWGGGNCLVLPKDLADADRLQSMYGTKDFDSFVTYLGAKGAKNIEKPNEYLSRR